MARAFTDADIVQGPVTGSEVTGTPTPTLPDGTTAGNTGIIVMGGAINIDPPLQWDVIAGAGNVDETSPQVGVMCRADLPAGETSWGLTLLGGATSAAVMWTVAEWANISNCPLAAKAFQPGTNAPASVALSAPLLGDLTPIYNLAIAALVMFSAAGAAVWSPVTWSGGFVETDVISQGTGAASGDLQLRVARRYGTLDEAGPWATTATFTDGTQTLRTVFAALGVFRAEHHVGEA